MGETEARRFGCSIAVQFGCGCGWARGTRTAVSWVRCAGATGLARCRRLSIFWQIAQRLRLLVDRSGASR